MAGAAVAIAALEVATLRWDLVRLYGAGWRRWAPSLPYHVVDLVAANLWCQALVGLPVGIGLAAWLMASAQRRAAGAPWTAAAQRQQAAATRRIRRKVECLARHPDDGLQCDVPALAAAWPGATLRGWVQRGYLVPPERLRGRALGLVGAPGSGKSTSARRLAAVAGARGRRLVLVDCKATEPAFADEMIAAWEHGAGEQALVRRWPAEALDGWDHADPLDLANRLHAGHRWSEPYYEALSRRAVQLACLAPDGPPRSSGELLARLSGPGLVKAWADVASPTMRAEVEDLTKARGFDGIAMRYGAWFAQLRGAFDGAWTLGEPDVAVFSLPTLAGRQDAAAAFAFLAEYLGWYATRRKARVGDDLEVIVDEYSAVAGAGAVVDLIERCRDVGMSVTVAAQSWEGLGPEGERERLVASLAGLIVGATPDPVPLLRAAGTIWRPELTGQLDEFGNTGRASVHQVERPAIDPNVVRQLDPGEVFVISEGRYARGKVLRTDRVQTWPLAGAERLVWAAERMAHPDVPPAPSGALERAGEVLALPAPGRAERAAADAARSGAAPAVVPIETAVVLERAQRRRVWWRRAPAILRWLHRHRPAGSRS